MVGPERLRLLVQDRRRTEGVGDTQRQTRKRLYSVASLLDKDAENVCTQCICHLRGRTQLNTFSFTLPKEHQL